MHARHARPRPGRLARGLLVTVLCAAGVGAAAVLWRDPTADRDPAREAVASAVPAVASHGAEPTARATVAPEARATRVLRSWDRARAAAWARGSRGALRRLYVGGAGASDVRLLGSYRERGLRVTGMRVQVLALHVLGHRPGEWRLRVTDRLATGTAVGPGIRQPLPRDRATTRTLRLLRVGDRWRVVSVS